MPTVSPSPGDPHKPARVRAMFDGIADRYDLFNDILSAGIHRLWRRRAVDALAPRAGGAYLDVCAGTLDLTAAIGRRAPGGEVVGADFSLPMLARGRAKRPGVAAVAADALALPWPEGRFDGCAIAFGLRNLADPGAGLAEMRRVLAPGGRLVVLEFTTPPGRLFRPVYHAYFHHVLPRLGGLVAGDAGAARYLPASVAAFPGPVELARAIAGAGFARVRHRLLTGGIAALHVAAKE